MNYGTALIRQVSFSFILNSCNIFFLLMTTVILARNMEADAFGMYVMQLSIVTILSVLMSYGMPTFLTREIAATAGRNGESDVYAIIFFSITVSSVLLISLLSVMAVIYIFFKPVFLFQFGSGALIFLVGKVFSDLFAGILFGFGEVVKGQLITAVLAGGVSLIVLVYYVLLCEVSPTIVEVFYMHSVGVVFSVVLGFFWVVIIAGNNKVAKNKKIKWKIWIAECHPLILINGLSAFNQNVIFIVLGVLCTPEAVGLYRVADRVGAFAQFLRNSIVKVISPIIAKNWVLGEKLLIEKTLGLACYANTIFNALFLLAGLLVGKTVIVTVFGADYADAWLPLVLLTFGCFVGSAFGFNGALLTMSSHAKVVSHVLGATVASQILLTIPLGHFYMELGAAIAAALAFTVNAFLLWVLAKKITGVDCSIINYFYKGRSK